jgi:hypothetical protein
MLEAWRAIGIVPLAVHDSFIVPLNHRGALEDTMENAFKPPKIPCGNRGQFRDKLSSGDSTGNAESVSRIWDGEVRGAGTGEGPVLSERAISSTPENRCEPEPGQTFAVVTIRATKRQPRSRCDGEDWGTAWAKLDKLGMQLWGDRSAPSQSRRASTQCYSMRAIILV